MAVNKLEVIKKIQNHEISAEEGFRLIKGLRKGIKQEYSFSDDKPLAYKIENDLLNLISPIIKIDKSKISSDRNFQEYGFDSIMLTSLTQNIKDTYKFEITPDVFFQNPSVKSLAKYFDNNFKSECEKRFNITEQHKIGKPAPVGKKPERGEIDNPEEKDKDSLDALPLIKGSIEKRVRFVSNPIWVLNAGKTMPDDGYMEFWHKLALKKLPPVSIQNISKETLKMMMAEGYNYLHLLVDVPSETRFEVVMFGSGKPLLFIPPAGLTAPICYFQFKELSSKNRIIIIHAPGCGLSQGLLDLSLINISKMYIKVMNELGIDMPVNIAGGSWGGMVAQAFAYKYPSYVSSLILCCTITEMEDQESEQIKLREQMKADFLAVKNGEKYWEMLLKSECIEIISFSNYVKYFKKDTKNSYNTKKYLDKITSPTLIVTSSQDSLAGTAESEYMHSKIANSVFYKIEGAGHTPFVTHYHEFNTVMSDFIESHS